MAGFRVLGLLGSGSRVRNFLEEGFGPGCGPYTLPSYSVIPKFVLGSLRTINCMKETGFEF